MKAFVVYSSYAPPKRILASDDRSAVNHYATSYLLNGGRPAGATETVRYRVYEDDEAATVH